MAAAPRPSGLALYTRLLRQARPHWPLIAALILISLLSTPIALLMPLPLQISIDSVLGSEPLPAALQLLVPARTSSGLLLLLSAALLGVALADYFQRLGVALLGTYTGEKLTLDFRAKLFR